MLLSITFCSGEMGIDGWHGMIYFFINIIVLIESASKLHKCLRSPTVYSMDFSRKQLSDSIYQACQVGNRKYGM